MYVFEILAKLWSGTNRMIQLLIKRNNMILPKDEIAEKSYQSTKSYFKINEETMAYKLEDNAAFLDIIE